MKKIALLLLFLMPLAVIAQKEVKPGSVKYLDYKRSFKEITLGAPITSIEEYVMESNNEEDFGPGMKAFEVIDAEMKKISDLVTIRDIYVMTFEDKILMIVMKMDKPNGSKMNDVLVQAYGGGRKPNQFMDRYAWLGKYVLVMLDNEGLNEDVLVMQDRELDKKREVFLSEQNKKAVTDF